MEEEEAQRHEELEQCQRRGMLARIGEKGGGEVTIREGGCRVSSCSSACQGNMEEGGGGHTLC